MKEHGFITDSDILSESGNKSTFETYHLRAKAVSEEISLKETEEDGSLIDSMDIAKKLYEDNLTPGELCWEYLRQGRKILPDFYRSDLQNELNRLWDFQKTFYPDVLMTAVCLNSSPLRRHKSTPPALSRKARARQARLS